MPEVQVSNARRVVFTAMAVVSSCVVAVVRLDRWLGPQNPKAAVFGAALVVIAANCGPTSLFVGRHVGLHREPPLVPLFDAVSELAP